VATQRQIWASRHNGAKSRGPKTQAGKARSRLNAVTHGFATTIVRDADKIQQIDVLAQHIARHVQPGLAREIAAAEIELQRIRYYQTELHNRLALDTEAIAEPALVDGIEAAGTAPSVVPDKRVVASGLVGSAADEVSTTLDKIIKSQRYERRAETKLNRAIHRKIEND
jgi:hypothetical protein